MQQKDSTFKYVQFWNNQALDTDHDIIISVDYALHNYNDTPSCGFCIALFESITDKPRVMEANKPHPTDARIPATPAQRSERLPAINTGPGPPQPI